MNPITCGMAADLLPLYLDGAPDVQLTVRSGLTFREAFSLMLQEL